MQKKTRIMKIFNVYRQIYSSNKCNCTRLVPKHKVALPVLRLLVTRTTTFADCVGTVVAQKYSNAFTMIT